MCQEKNFMCFIFVFAVSYGSMGTFAIFLSNIFSPFGYTPGVLSEAACYGQLASVIFSIPIGIFLDRMALYRYTQIALNLL